jgi:GT2 family glycosyltransferase
MEEVMARSTPEPLIAVVILNTNRRADTLECLASLAQGSYQRLRTIVLDCMSSDGSAEAVASAFPDVRVVRLSQNRGYAGNNNVGIRIAIEQEADWVLVLNEDTILAPDCLERLVEAAEGHRRIGIVGPTVYHHDEPHVIQSGGGRLGPYWQSIHVAKNEADRGQLSGLQRVEWISGCAIMVRREAIEEAGMLDESFFVYWEETEWCVRIRKAGWSVVQQPLAKIWHKGVQRNYRPAPRVTYYLTRNRFLLLSKHQAPLIAWFQAWFEVCRTLVSWSVRKKWNGMRQHRNAMWRGMVDFLFGRFGGPVEV